jgi:hypothetical protein
MLEGAAAFRARIAKLVKEVPLEVGRGLYQEGLVEQKESMRRTPVDTGALRASHETTLPTYEGRDISVKIQVGGPSAPYAVEVHENLEAHHEVGQAKFLESTLNESKPHMAERLAKRIDLNRLAE